MTFFLSVYCDWEWLTESFDLVTNLWTCLKNILFLTLLMMTMDGTLATYLAFLSLSPLFVFFFLLSTVWTAWFYFVAPWNWSRDVCRRPLWLLISLLSLAILAFPFLSLTLTDFLDSYWPFLSSDWFDVFFYLFLWSGDDLIMFLSFFIISLYCLLFCCFFSD
jgi:hypothetical protein